MIDRQPDIGLLRFLRAPADERAVLNAPAPDLPIPSAGPRAASRQAEEPDPDIAIRVVRAARALVPAGIEGVPYVRIARSAEFAAYRALTRKLPGFDPARLRGREERAAFWINTFNALVIDAVISLGVRESVREARGFFHRAAYQIGPHRFALADIEHGLLRGNRPLHPRLPPPFPPGDPRVALGPGVLDPRIHFALNCGTRSCPPVAFYEAARLDEQFDAAAAAFINSEGVHVEHGKLAVSPLFALYAEDFGGPEGVTAWLLRYLVSPTLRRRVTAGTLRPGSYDWSLNRDPDDADP